MYNNDDLIIYLFLIRTGAKGAAAPAKCKGCEGRGVKMIVKQIGPGMIQQMQTVCPDCQGKGEIIKPEDQCPECKGKKVTKEKKLLTVYIDKGMKNNQKIVFAGDSDEAPGMEPGDIIFVLAEKPHSVFKRSGADLIMEMNITLVEALSGMTKTIKHLDDRTLLLQTDKADVITPGELRVIAHEGMPIHKRPDEKGNLYIKFSVEFPKPGFLKDKQLQELEKLLGGRPAAPKLPNEVEKVRLEKATPQHERESRERQKAARAQEAYDDEEHGGRGGVQCAQQ